MPNHPSEARSTASLRGSAFSLSAAGGAHKSVHAAPRAAAAPEPAQARPMNTAPDTDASPPAEAVALPPAPPPSVAPPPAVVTIQPPEPAAPRRPAEDQPTDAESEQPAHPPAPQISPQ